MEADRLQDLRPWCGLCLYPTSFAGALLPLRWVSSQGLAAQVFDGQGESCRVSHRCRAAQRVDLLSDMVGFRSEDGVVYLADCLSSKETLEKYQIGVIYDVGAYLDTLEQVKQLSATWFVPAHAEATQDIAPLAQYNIDKTREVAETILTFCAEPIGFEALLQKLFTAYGLTMDFSQYVLVGSTVRSYLAWLKDQGALSVDFTTRIPLWHRVG